MELHQKAIFTSLRSKLLNKSWNVVHHWIYDLVKTEFVGGTLALARSAEKLQLISPWNRKLEKKKRHSVLIRAWKWRQQRVFKYSVCFVVLLLLTFTSRWVIIYPPLHKLYKLYRTFYMFLLPPPSSLQVGSPETRLFNLSGLMSPAWREQLTNVLFLTYQPIPNAAKKLKCLMMFG